MAVRYIGIATVAEWFAVSPATVCNWRRRHGHFPEPDAYIEGVLGWLPERKEDWMRWRREHGPRPYVYRT